MSLMLQKLLNRGLIGPGTASEIIATLGTPALNAVLDRFMSANNAALAASLIGASNLSDEDTLKLARLFSRALGVSTAYAAALELQRLSESAVSNYHADAVHFDGGNFFQRVAVLDGISAGVTKFLWSYWIANTVKTAPQIRLDHIPIASSQNTAYFLLGSRGFDATEFLVSTSDGNDFMDADTDDLVYPIADWTHVAVSADLSFAADVDKIVQVFVNGTQKATGKSGSGAVLAMPLHQTDAYPFYVGHPNDANSQSVYDGADMQFWAGQFVDLTNAANLAKLISGGKPVDPAVAAAAFGTQTLLHSGDATNFNNQGSGGLFQLVQPGINTPGRNGPGSCALAGAVIGAAVKAVLKSDGTDVTADFESVISVTDQIQQTGAQNYVAFTLQVHFGGTLTNASTSPSD